MPIFTIGGLLRPLCPPLREELTLAEDVLRELSASLHHDMLFHLSNAEATLPPPVPATVLVGDYPWTRRGVLRPFHRHHLGEIHLASKPVQVSCRRVIRAGGLLDGVERAEAEAHLAGSDLSVERVGGARANAAVAKSSSAVRRHGGAAAARRERRQRGAWRGE
ncbi:hypothetical protein D1007_08521 [Hordeum vulgare]|nr:hypothetical protein D1007_08521 [Hordeum vulgare]